MKKILLAIPCFNCSKQIKRVIDEINHEKFNFLNQIIFVDNRSEDDTVNSIKSNISNNINNSKYILIQNDFNYGLGGSHKVIFNYALENNYDYVIILHGDNQAKTSEIKSMYDELDVNKSDKYDAILGSRFMKNSKLIGYSIIRKYGNIILNYIYTLFKLKSVKDLGSGLNIFNTNFLKTINYLEFDDGFTFNMDILLSLINHKANIKFIPITWSETDQISNAKALSVGFKTLNKLFLKSKYENKFKFTYKIIN